MEKERIKKFLPYILFSLVNVLFLTIPLAVNNYTTKTQQEYYANEIAKIVQEQKTENNTFAVTMLCTNKEEGKVYPSNALNIAPNTYNNSMFYIDPFHLSNGIYTKPNKIQFFFEDEEYSKINYMLTSGIYSNHEHRNRHVFNYYYLGLWSKDSNTTFDGFNNFCYISKNHADAILESHSEYTSYDDIINKGLTVKYNDQIFSWKISNIVTDYYLFYDGLVKVYGDFILPYSNGVARNLKIDSELTAYFGGNTFTNIQLMKYLSNYEHSKFSIYRDNLTNVNSDKLDEIETYLNTLPTFKSNDYIFYFEVMGCSFLLIGCIFFLLKIFKPLKILPLSLCYLGSILTVYSIFWIIYKATNNILYLSYIGVLGYLIVLGVSLLSTGTIYLIQKHQQNEKN